MNIQPNNQFAFSAAERPLTDDCAGTSTGTDNNGRRVVRINCSASSSSTAGDISLKGKRGRYAPKAKTEDEREKAQALRKIKNREAAKRSRDAEKKKLADLEERVKNITTKNKHLSLEINKLREEVFKLQENNNALKEAVGTDPDKSGNVQESRKRSCSDSCDTELLPAKVAKSESSTFSENSAKAVDVRERHNELFLAEPIASEIIPIELPDPADQGLNFDTKLVRHNKLFLTEPIASEIIPTELSNPDDQGLNFDTKLVDETITYQASSPSESELFPQLDPAIEIKSEPPTP